MYQCEPPPPIVFISNESIVNGPRRIVPRNKSEYFTSIFLNIDCLLFQQKLSHKGFFKGVLVFHPLAFFEKSASEAARGAPLRLFRINNVELSGVGDRDLLWDEKSMVLFYQLSYIKTSKSQKRPDDCLCSFFLCGCRVLGVVVLGLARLRPLTVFSLLNENIRRRTVF